MDVANGDIDGDGDLDLVLAQEYGRNIVLFNSGDGVFTEADSTVKGTWGDNEDVLLRDFDGDGDLDMVTVHEDDGDHAYLLNDGAGNFTRVEEAFEYGSTANGVATTDFDGDGYLDLVLGNAGKNLLLMNQAGENFLVSEDRWSPNEITTQDVLLVDIDGDSDLDVFAANEGPNSVFVNSGDGSFENQSAARLPEYVQESREADAADIDADGDMDILVGNVPHNLHRPHMNQLLVNDGEGNFIDATAAGLEGLDNGYGSFTVKFVDLNGDGHIDIISPRGGIGWGTVDSWINDGSGTFHSREQVFSHPPKGSVFDIEVFDANGDGKQDLYFCYQTGVDQLYISQQPPH